MPAPRFPFVAFRGYEKGERGGGKDAAPLDAILDSLIDVSVDVCLGLSVA